ncbi:MAG: pyruvate kinase [Hymenobacteraceae bacterium]|nr:pyruvate kinase [Hymenobacteraceae bacterium]
MALPYNRHQLHELISQIDMLQNEAIALEKKFAPEIRKVNQSFRKSAKNLLHYLALRHHDIRTLQESLAALGLSSLGRSEGHVLASLQAVRRQLCFLLECEPEKKHQVVSFFDNKKLLNGHTTALLGAAPKHRFTRIMVTFSTEDATNYSLVLRMLNAGMGCARINCAHDDKATWLKMINNVRKAEAETGISCKILIDLMGPKLRTGPMQPGPQLVAIRPIRNELGQITAPATVWLAPAGTPPPLRVDATLPVAPAWLAKLQEGDKLRLHDTRGRKRTLAVMKKEDAGFLAHIFKTAYISAGTEIKVKNHTATEATTQVEELPALQNSILLKKDNFLILTKELIPGEPAQYDAKGHIIKPAHISCTFPDIFTQVKPGEPILFDDGEIEGVIEEVDAEKLLIRIVMADENGSRLRCDKGINLPESKLKLEGLTEKDRQDLAFIVKHADIVNLSFVNNVAMVEDLQKELQKLKAKNLAVMLKIKTKEGFKNLPHLLLAAMRSYPAGIMIARGDLAVECGWQRLAEVQEEILWLCEAAHLPVVWATQVLEKLAKKGRPSRAEITDAAMSQRADCVMLNKGPHVIQAIEMLDDILKRMQKHQNKKTSMLRSLHVSELEQLQEEQAVK